MMKFELVLRVWVVLSSRMLSCQIRLVIGTIVVNKREENDEEIINFLNTDGTAVLHPQCMALR